MESELENYRGKLLQIDAELMTCSDPAQREALVATRSDMCELIGLLEETQDNVEGEVVSEAPVDSQSFDSDAADFLDEIIGLHCRAPYKKVVDKAVDLHDAVILDVLDQSVSPEKVSVLYMHPIEMAMKPCKFFLDDLCTYGDECRFSHGEPVHLSDVVDYKNHDFSSVKKDSLVLVQKDDGLWCSARVMAIDGETLAVLILSTGREIPTVFGRVIPLEESPLITNTAMPSSSSWPELKSAVHRDVSAGEIGDWERHTRGIGMKLLLKMGYRVGEGLGRNSNGIVHAIQPTVFAKNRSLDVCFEKKRKMMGDTIHTKKKRSKLEVTHQLNQTGGNVDIFDLLNSKLNSVYAKNVDARDSASERKKLQESSPRDLGIQSFICDKEIKELKKKMKSLKKGILRNQRDDATVKRMKDSMKTCQRDIDRCLARYSTLTEEIEGRRSQKNIF